TPLPRACIRAADRTAPCTPRRRSSPSPRASWCSWRGSSCPPRSPSARGRAPPAPIARLARLLLQERQPAQQILHPDLRRFDSLAQQLVLLLHLGGAGLDLGVGPGGSRAARATLLQLGFGLLRARAPGGQLVRHVAEDRLELVAHLRTPPRPPHPCSPLPPLAVVHQPRPPTP